MKKLFILAVLALILLQSSCTPHKNPERKTPYTPAVDTLNLPTPSVSPTPPVETPETVDSKNVLSAAELYRDIYISVYEKNPAGVFLTDSETEAILARLGEKGLAAVDTDGLYVMKNSNLAESFISGGNTQLTINELCSDGGYICHDLSSHDGTLQVIMSRVSWLDGGEFQLSGDIPTVTFSAKYQVTALEISPEGCLIYDYYMPDNPEGTNHDGHVETTVKLRMK